MIPGVVVVVAVLLFLVGTRGVRARAIRRANEKAPDLRRAGDAPLPQPKSSTWMGPLN